MKSRRPSSPKKHFNPHFSRRALLGGIGASALLAPFIPTLESQASGSGFPKRLILLWSPNGSLHENWVPTGSQDNFELGRIHSPLQAHKDKLIVLDGITLARDGPGGSHHRGMGCQWTGSALLEGTEFSSAASGTSGWGGGISIDHRYANEVGNQTPYKSLEFGVQSTGNSVLSRMSYAGSNQPVTPEINPAAMFDRLYAELAGGVAEQERLRLERRSVLDLVSADLARLQNRYSGADRIKVEAHVNAVREIERRNNEPVQTCQSPDQSGVADHLENANFPRVSRDMIDQLVSALACDLTRVASLQWSRAGSNTVFEWLGQDEGHHSISHLGDNDQSMRSRITAINTWYAGEMAYLLDSLDAISEGDGTLLDNTLVVWGNGLARGNRHSNNPMPYVLAGGAGGAIQTGRFLKYDGARHNRLLVSILRAMDVDVDSFGTNDRGSGGLADL